MTDYEKSIILPSHGVFYDGSLPGGELQIKSMTTQEEKLLASPSSSSGTKLLDILFKRCSSFPESFPPSKLIVFDRFSLLMNIRILSYGPIYRISFVCEECKHRNNEDLNLEEILSEEVIATEDSESQHDVELPVSKKNVTWRYPTGEDELALDKQRSKLKGGSPADLIEHRIARQIVSIDGAVPQFLDILNFIRGLSTRDNVPIRDSIQEHTFGITSEFEFTCSNCAAPTASMGLPMSNDFFRLVSPAVRGSGL